MPKFRDALAITTKLARRTDDLVAFGELVRTTPVTARNVEDLQGAGAIHRVLHGIYLVGTPRLTQRQLWRAAEMMGRARSGLSARSTFEVRGIVPAAPGVAYLTTARRSVPKFVKTDVPLIDGGLGLIRVRHVVSAPPTENVEGLTCTRIPRGLVDLAASPVAGQLGHIWKQCEFRGLLRDDAIRAELDEARRHGGRAVRELFDAQAILTGESTDLRSVGELDVLRLIHEAGLPMPEVNVPMTLDGATYVADFYWRWLRLVLELDTPDHLRPTAGVRDRDRDGVFFVNDLDVVRYLDRKVSLDPDGFISWLTAVLARQQRRLT